MDVRVYEKSVVRIDESYWTEDKIKEFNDYMYDNKSKEELYEAYGEIKFGSGINVSHCTEKGFVLIPAKEVSMISIEEIEILRPFTKTGS